MKRPSSAASHRRRNTSADPKTAASRSTDTSTHRSSSPASLTLIDDLRERLGERNFVSILQTVSDAVRSAANPVDFDNEFARLRLRNAARVAAQRETILKDTVSSDEAGSYISRSRPVVIRLANTGQLLAVKDGRSLRFPRWQFDESSEDGIVSGLRRVLAVMDGSAFRKAAWMSTPNVSLGGRPPIEVLRDGQFDLVYEEAASVTSG